MQTYSSWKSTFVRLTSPIKPCQSSVTALSNHLASATSISQLSRCYDPFPPPSADSKTEFEKRTAPINFTAADQPAAAPSASAEAGHVLPPIAELKEAVLEFSKSLHINEVGALRIVVLEYQERPAVALLNASEDSSTGNVFDNGNAESQLRASGVISDEETKRKVFWRRVEIYLQERRYIVKVAALMVRLAMCAEKSKNVWYHPARVFATEGINMKDGYSTEVVGSIATRWRNGKNGQGLPEWVKQRMALEGDDPAFKWELQVRI